MILGIYCVRDKKTTFMTPNVDYNDMSAIRNFEHAIRNTESLFYSHAEDYELYKLGEFDSETGEIIPFDVTNFIVDGSSIRKD